MSLLNYIHGQKKGKEAHKLEREAMKDPFLYEAMEGFDSVEDDHLARISSLQRKINLKNVNKIHSSNRRKLWNSVAVAAAVVLIGIASSLLVMTNKEQDMYAEAALQYPIDLYLPDKIYEENIAVIAMINTELTKDIAITVKDYKVNKKELEKERSDSNSEETILSEPIDLFIPNGEKAEK